jgi:hypothetical protein
MTYLKSKQNLINKFTSINNLLYFSNAQFFYNQCEQIIFSIVIVDEKQISQYIFFLLHQNILTSLLTQNKKLAFACVLGVAVVAFEKTKNI